MRPERLLPALITLAVAAVYFAAGKAGLALAEVHPSATAIWPPTGIALAALLVFGYRVWPGILVGAFLVNVTTAGTPVTSAAIAVGNTLEGLAGAWLIQRFAGGARAYASAPGVFKAAILGGFVATSLSATVGVVTLVVSGLAIADAPRVWLTWWLGDAGGALVVAPALVLWLRGPRPAWSAARAVEGFVVIVALVGAAGVAFAGLAPVGLRNAPFAFLFLPPLLWAAYRFGPWGASTSTLLIAAIAIPGTLAGFGTFALLTAYESLLFLQLFIAVLSVSALALGAEAEDRRATADALARARDGLDLQVRERTAALRSFHFMISHDLKEPVRAIDAYLTAAQEDTLPDIARQDVRRAQEANQRLLAMLSGLRELSRVPGLGGEEAGPVRIEETIRSPECVARYRDFFDRREARLEVTVEAGAPAALASLSMVSQVLGNLLVNAVKHNGKTSPRVRVRVLAAPESRVEVVVEDDGPGFSARELERLAARGMPTSLVEGGVGLVIVRRLVEALGGTLRVARSADLGGASVHVLLPAA